MEARVIEKDYISRNIFDLHMQNMKEKAKSAKKIIFLLVMRPV